MANLPVRYMRILFNVTGYWGTYLPTRTMQPGMIGRRRDGKFEQVTHLERCPGYDAELLGLESYAHEDALAEWSSEGVVLGGIKPSIDAPGKIAHLNMNLEFEHENDALVLLEGITHHQYSDTRHLKSLLYDLRELGEWEEDYCVVTEVIEAKTAWIFLATDTKQSAALSAETSVLPATAPASLKQLVGDAAIATSLDCKNFRGFFSKQASPSTPLFSAMRFNSEWWQLGLGKPDLLALKGADTAFEEATFGE